MRLWHKLTWEWSNCWQGEKRPKNTFIKTWENESKKTTCWVKAAILPTMSLSSLSYLLFPTLVRGSPATSAKDRWDYTLLVIVGKNVAWIAIVVSNAVCVKYPTCLMSTPSQFVFFEQHTCGLWGEHTETCDSNTEYCTLVMRQQVNLKLTKTKAGIKTKAEEKDKYKDKDKYQDRDS